jgi:hypothetical protein
VLHDGTTLQGRVTDLYLDQGREWLRMADGRSLRLARIASHRDA